MTTATAEKPDEPSLSIPKAADPDEALRAIESNAPTEAEEKPDIDPKAHEEYEFEIDVVDGAGKHWHGQFKNAILSIEDRVNVGLLQTQLNAGIPYVAIDTETANLSEVIAHLTKSLKKKPAWFILAGKECIKNIRILNAVYGEVMAHEATFRGSDPTPTES
jgi:hypothetical protein